MADIFFSYQREDRAKVEPLVRLFEAHGFTVWWDPSIVPGERFAAVIRKALDEVSCVIVGWSAHSVDSIWVQDEAATGRDRGMLVPVSLDGATPPLGFRQFQTQSLYGWKGNADDSRIQQVIAGVRRLVGEPVKPAPAVTVVTEADLDTAGRLARIDAERAHWETIRKGRRAGDFEQFLADYPRGHFAGPARARMAQLRERNTNAGGAISPDRRLVAAGVAALAVGLALVAHQLGVPMPWTPGADMEAKRQAEQGANAKAAAEVKGKAEEEAARPGAAAEKAKQDEAKHKTENRARPLWMTPLTPRDQDLVSRLDAIRTKWLADAQITGDVKEFAEVTSLLRSEQLTIDVSRIEGRWRCRSIQFGFSTLFVYGFFECRVRREGNTTVFEKPTGSQKKLGILQNIDGRRLLYYGASYTDFVPLKKYGTSSDTDEAGILSQVAVDRLRLEVVRGTDDYEILELVRK